MPYRWTDPDTLTLWPHNALGARGFVWTIGLLSAGLSIPLIGQIGHATLWVILTAVVLTVGLLWFALRRNQADRAILETLTLTPDLLTLERRARQGGQFQANPHWVRLALYPKEGPVPDYLTLAGNGREVELGAFLTPEERRLLHKELARRLADLR